DIKYNSLLAITIARYESQKRLDEAIRAFKLVVNKIPTAKYDIYGSGSQKESLERLIMELGLEHNVRLKGYTNDNMNKLSEAACSILTSEYEGIVRVLTERLYAVISVVSYDTNNVLSYIVRNNIAGFSSDKGNG